MRYKFNTYLLANKNESGNLIIFNTLTGSAFYIERDSLHTFAKLYKQICEDYDFPEEEENINVLLNSGIICHNTDERIDDLLQDREKRVFNEQKFVSLTLLPTEKCNFRCSYCYESHNGETMNERTIDKVEALIELLVKDYDMIHLNWFGGEPLLAIDVMRKITKKTSAICKKYRKSYYSSITTNGFFLTTDMMKELLKMHVLLYQVTIDGDKNTHDRQRYLQDGRGTYDTIFQNLVKIKNEIRTATIKIIVRINVPNSIESYGIDLLSETFCDDKRFNISVQRIFKSRLHEETDFEEYLKMLEHNKKYTTSSLTPEQTICYAAKKIPL